MRFKKNNTILFIDSDVTYHFIVGEMLKNKSEMVFASTVETSVDAIKKHTAIELIILCIDDINHQYIINALFQLFQTLKPLILVSRNTEAIHMYDLLTVYGASNFMIKPFSKQAMIECVENAKKHYPSPFNQRLLHDLTMFNRRIIECNNQFTMDAPLPLLRVAHLDKSIQDLMNIKKTLEGFHAFPKSSRQHILFIDDEKNIIDNYQLFVENKPFKAHFSKSLAESRQVMEQTAIDIIVLDLGLPDGHGITLLKEIYHDHCTPLDLPDVIVVSSYFDKDTVVDVINAGAKVFLNKPMTFKKLMSVIYQITFLRYMRKEFLAKSFTKLI